MNVSKSSEPTNLSLKAVGILLASSTNGTSVVDLVSRPQALSARAIAVDPEIILMDEPCSALDPIATARIEELIDDLKVNYTIVIVTHSMQQASRVSQKTAYFHLGNVIEFGDTKQIFSNPKSSQTEAYISGRIG